MNEMQTYNSTISIHAPREGRDGLREIKAAQEDIFQSTRPARGATPVTRSVLRVEKFQSTRPARGATWRRLWAK